MFIVNAAGDQDGQGTVTPLIDDARDMKLQALNKKYRHRRDKDKAIQMHIKEEQAQLREHGYPRTKIDEHVFNIQVQKGLKRKDLFFEKVVKNNMNLLDLNSAKPKAKPFEQLLKWVSEERKEPERSSSKKAS